ncbi:9-O-acetylesterase, partial [bacterium]|nr:9-O-acetylesterase [bacterium]
MKKLVFALLFLLALPGLAELKLATPFCDHAVLQQGKKVPVWGKTEPGNKVCVSFAGQSVSAKADENGNWMVYLEPLEASFEGREMKVSDGTDEKIVSDVLVGEVWFASGQSNMECPIWDADPRFR